MRVVLSVLIILSCTFGLFAKSRETTALAGSRDTTFIKRPYYLGLSVGYTQWLHAFEGNQFNAPVYIFDLYDTRTLNFGISPAIQLSFPFLRRMECEASLQRTTWYGVRSDVTEYHYSATGNDILGFRTVKKWFDQSAWQVRTIFSYEFYRTEHFAFVAGMGGRLDLQDHDDRNNYAGEVQLKCYLESENFGTFQFSLTAGANGLDVFTGVRVGYMLKGTRTYRVKPDKYYTRTYEEGE